MRRNNKIIKNVITETILCVVEGVSEENILKFIINNHKIGRYQSVKFVDLQKVRISTTSLKDNNYKLNNFILDYSKTYNNIKKVIFWIDSDRFLDEVKQNFGNKIYAHDNVKIFWFEPNLENCYKNCNYLINEKNKPHKELNRKTTIEKILENEDVQNIVKEIIFDYC